MLLIFKWLLDESNDLGFAPSEDVDQPGHFFRISTIMQAVLNF